MTFIVCFHGRVDVLTNQCLNRPYKQFKGRSETAVLVV